ncbi:hypothetical protein [Sandarakinorhabdus cyanobacteriorum]|uniref:hypothetical protein n=1 Tax=Sandarakinorhabdus cyanobacteriorum TaxID=1981098 RepID=UPI00311AA998
MSLGCRAKLPELPVGARVRILPNHACATAAHHAGYHVINAACEEALWWPRKPGW